MILIMKKNLNLTKFFRNIVQQYWIEVTTAQPICTYYFDPFFTCKEANFAQSGFIEDLETENAEIIKVEIQRCKPNKLTIIEQLNDNDVICA